MGHAHITDFNVAIHYSERRMHTSVAGSMAYMAPEVIGRLGYTWSCDWWSLGAIMFECLVGYPPFCSESTHDTYQKIIHWQQYLMFPDDVHLSHEAEDLIRRYAANLPLLGCLAISLTYSERRRLITSQDRRLAVEGIRNHPFFLGVNWNTIRQIEAPFIPRLRSMTDTSYFPTEELEQVPDEPVSGDSAGAQKDLAFLG